MKASSALLAAILLSSPIAFGAVSTNGITGNWLGTLDAGSVRLRVLFKITQAPGGALTAKLDSLDQGASDLPVDSATLNGDAVRMEVKMVQGVYEGTLNKAGTKMTGRWQQGPSTLPLTLERSEAGDAAAKPRAPGSGQAAPYRPPDYVKPALFQEREIAKAA